MAIVFSGEAALAFSIIGGLLLATGTALLGRVLLGLPAAALSLPLRWLGAPGLLASTGLAANRWRTAALATPVVLITMLVGTQAIAQVSSQEKVERTTAARVTADHVVAGRDGAPLPAGTAAELGRLPGVDAAAGIVRTECSCSATGSAGTRRGPRPAWSRRRAPRARPARDARAAGRRARLGRGDQRGGRARGPSRGGRHDARAAGRHAPATLRVAAVYDRAAGLGDVVLDAARRAAPRERARRRRRVRRGRAARRRARWPATSAPSATR